MSLVAIQELHGVNMGNHHYEYSGAIAMLESMSGYAHTFTQAYGN